MGVYAGPTETFIENFPAKWYGSTSISGGVVTDGLVLALDAGVSRSYPGSGATWTDLSGNGNNGTLVNGVGYNSSNGGALSFDGVNDYVNLGTQSNLTGLIDISVSGWSRNSGTIITRYYNTTSGNGWFLSSSSFGGRENVSQYISVPSGYTPSIGEWGYYVGTKSGNVWSIYVNGILANSITIGNGTTPFANNVMYVAAYPHFSSYFNINVSQVSIYNRALTPQEIQQNFNAQRGRFGI
jgi:hypothetical protein